MPELVAMRGYPASGKTTRARGLALDTGAVVVGRDFLRHMMFDNYVPGPGAEEDVTVAENAAVRALLKSGASVIVDNCHLTHKYLKRWAVIASECGADFRVEDVKTSAHDCMFRDAVRESRGERFVGANVILRFAKRYPIKSWPTIVKRDATKVEPYVRPEGKPEAVIVDIDGTVAFMNGRSPYDYSRVLEDGVHEDMRRTLQDIDYQGDCHILFVSGRDDVSRADTLSWLKVHSVPYDELFMRPTGSKDEFGNKKRDFDIKLELFNEHIRDHYNVRNVFDDRNQVVELWRALGLRCYQVAPGDF